MNIWRVRISGVIILLITIWYFYWIFGSINLDAYYLSIPFVVASFLLALNTSISIINHWRFQEPKLELLAEGLEPRIGIIIPTYNEPIEMVIKTVESVLNQNYPQEKMVIVVGDDGHSPDLNLAIGKLEQTYKKAKIFYLETRRQV